MPCMCGDYCCPSCGPAQGNWHCPICGKWASEGCEHINHITGRLKKQYEKQAEEIAKKEAEADDFMYKQYLEDKKLGFV